MKKNKNSKQKDRGFSLIEMLVVLAVFSVIGVVAAQSVLTTLRGAKRTDSDARVRENIDYVMALLERHIRNAKDVTCSSSTRVNFLDQASQNPYFSFVTSGTDGYIASSSSQVATPRRITANDIRITAASFVCTPALGNSPPTLTITISATDSNSTGAESADITVSTTINLRTSY